MKASTRAEIKRIMEDFVALQAPKFQRISVTELRLAYPFHRLVFPDSAILASRLERSIVTAMGRDLYPRLAEAVALDKYNVVRRNHPLDGQLNDAACNLIEQIVTELRARSQKGVSRRKPDHFRELADILASRGGGIREVPVIADLYVGDFSEGPLFLELKTPLPNLDIAAESKRKMLYYLALMDRRSVKEAKALLGLTYNPYVTRAKYAHSFTKQIMDMEHEVLLGQELWDYLGGNGTYQELLSIIDSIRRL